MTESIINIIREDNAVVVESIINEITISSVGAQGIQGPQGVQGPVGPQGPQGIQGLPGQATNIYFTFEQQFDSNLWTINHNLGYRPAVTVKRYDKITIEGEIDYTDANTLTISFSAPVSGYAYLS